jgi:hypothetical protein
MSVDKNKVDAFNILKNTDFRTRETKLKEDLYISRLLNKPELYRYSNFLLYSIIKKAKLVKLDYSIIKKIINSWILETLDDKKIIGKVGYKCDHENNCEYIINIDNFNDFLKYNIEHNISFLQIMGALYKFQIENKFLKLCMDNDKSLQKKFKKAMNTYFSVPLHTKYADICSIIDNSYGYWFYSWVITFMSSNVKNIVHHGLINDEDYVRKWNKNLEFNKNTSSNEYKFIDIEKSLKVKKNNLTNYNEKYIMLGNTYTVPRENGVWFNLMKTYKKQVIAGPSSSSVLTYQIVFNICKLLPQTKQNKIYLLYCILADYYQYYHSISEVLQEYTVDAKFKKYTLNMDDIKYINSIKKNC